MGEGAEVEASRRYTVRTHLLLLPYEWSTASTYIADVERDLFGVEMAHRRLGL